MQPFLTFTGMCIAYLDVFWIQWSASSSFCWNFEPWNWRYHGEKLRMLRQCFIYIHLYKDRIFLIDNNNIEAFIFHLMDILNLSKASMVGYKYGVLRWSKTGSECINYCKLVTSISLNPWLKEFYVFLEKTVEGTAAGITSVLAACSVLLPLLAATGHMFTQVYLYLYLLEVAISIQLLMNGVDPDYVLSLNMSNGLNNILSQKGVGSNETKVQKFYFWSIIPLE